MFVLSRKEMYKLDQYTTEKIGIPSKKLMENAGEGCSKLIKNLITPDSKVSIFCGSGNNGGDGFVIARYLKKWRPKIYFVGNTQKMSPETYSNYQLCINLNIEIIKLSKIEQLENLQENDLLIDALFGVGLQGTVHGFVAEIIAKINQSQIMVVAIDIASGIDADTGNSERAIIAKYTFTMATFKRGQILEEGRKHSGKVQIIDIGITPKVYEKFPPKAKLITEENVKYPVRSQFSHKGNYGRIGIIAGSPGFSGAGIMACKAALRSGAGLVTLFYPQKMETIFETQLLEVMTFGLPDFSNNIEINAEKSSFIKKINSMDALLFGPGIGISTHSKNLLQLILETWKKPLVIDADGLNILAEDEKLLDLLTEKIIITPHLGEFSRLSGKSISEIFADPLKELKTFYKKTECNILLKSATTIFYGGNEFLFDISGNDGLATGGSGDVLAGVIISFLGQKLSPQNAATSASYLLGKTAEKLAKTRKPASIIPSDIIDEIFKY